MAWNMGVLCRMQLSEGLFVGIERLEESPASQISSKDEVGAVVNNRKMDEWWEYTEYELCDPYDQFAFA